MSFDYSTDPIIKFKTFTSAKHLKLASTASIYAKQRSVMMKNIKDNNSTLTAKRYGLKLNTSAFKVKTASGEVLEIAGITDSLFIEI